MFQITEPKKKGSILGTFKIDVNYEYYNFRVKTIEVCVCMYTDYRVKNVDVKIIYQFTEPKPCAVLLLITFLWLPTGFSFMVLLKLMLIISIIVLGLQ